MQQSLRIHFKEENDMTDNTCVVYVEPGKVSVEKIDYPKLELPPRVPGRNRLCHEPPQK